MAKVLKASLCITTAVMNEVELDLSEPTDEEIAYLAMQGWAFDWLADEPDLYSDEDLSERYEWTEV